MYTLSFRGSAAKMELAYHQFAIAENTLAIDSMETYPEHDKGDIVGEVTEMIVEVFPPNLPEGTSALDYYRRLSAHYECWLILSDETGVLGKWNIGYEMTV